MKRIFEVGDVFENRLTKDKAIVIGNVPVAVKLPGESPMLHPDDPINVTDEKWIFVESRSEKWVIDNCEALYETL